jgi:methionyl-tRNA formyltransferase|tara:strand:- start:593 stop:1225 length:633 start_codon:yes stop_codon:yes gene_type:complete
MHILKIILHTNNQKTRDILRSYGHELVNNDYSRPDYIICYRTYNILSREEIDSVNVGAINFHTGPPEYPGRGSVNLALHHNKTNFGVTAHLMTTEIDNGRILDVRFFDIDSSDNVDTLWVKTEENLLKLFSDFCMGLDETEYITMKLDQNENYIWNGKANKMRQIDDLQVIPLDCSEEHLKNIIRSTYTPEFRPKIILHGYEFVMEKIND